MRKFGPKQTLRGVGRPRNGGWPYFSIQESQVCKQKYRIAQVEVATKLKRPQSYVSKCEAGEQRVDILELKKFTVLYKKNLSYFL